MCEVSFLWRLLLSVSVFGSFVPGFSSSVCFPVFDLESEYTDAAVLSYGSRASGKMATQEIGYCTAFAWCNIVLLHFVLPSLFWFFASNFDLIVNDYHSHRHSKILLEEFARNRICHPHSFYNIGLLSIASRACGAVMYS